ncbi:MAG: MFS transporter [Anaerolineae bacterium]|nr:MFS transporter [Anaerolineae bacterium]MCX8068010.1 MFS transporter [Anaerolineae bacterium]MDW7992953.1 MFS transporter [Anaerolineae bacterium]
MKHTPAHFRHNFIVLLTDYIFFGVAYAFLNPNTVLPAFARTLTDLEPLIGMVPTVMAAGWLLPQLGAAAWFGKASRKKPYLLRAIYAGRPVYFFLAFLIWMGLPHYRPLMLGVFLAGLLYFNVLDGIASVAWFDLLAATIPMEHRGRLVGMAQFASGVLSIGVGGLVGAILSSPSLPYPNNYALLFLASGLALVPSTVALTLLKEPERKESTVSSSEPRSSLSEFVRQLRSVWREDQNFRRLVFTRWLVGLFGLSLPFYILHATEVVGLPQAVTGWFVSAQMVGGIVASIGLGWMSTRIGPRPVIWVGALNALLSPLVALLVHFYPAGSVLYLYPLVYFCFGITNNTWMLGAYNYLLEIAPEESRPLFVGLYNTLGGLLIPVSLVGGAILRATSYPFLFLVTALGVALGLWVSLGLRDSRQKKAV